MSEATDKFDRAVAKFLVGCEDITREHFATTLPNLVPNAFTVTFGARYVKVITTSDGGRGQGSVFCFIDRNGDVLKAAGWKAPAKHARGNIFDEHDGLAAIGPYGPAYLK